jgi:predicted CXXCH cytochrome family protein
MLAILACALAAWGLGGEPPARTPPPAPGLPGSKHDFSAAPWTNGDLCVACHFEGAPDGAPPEALANPAADFNRTFADALQTDRGTPLAQESLRQAPERPAQDWPVRQAPYNQAVRKTRGPDDPPGPGTLTCLLCHDGTMASDMFGGLGGGGPTRRGHPAANRSAHGGSNHPVGVEYPLFDPEYRPVGLIEAEGLVPLPGGRVECVSCHDPHNELGRPYMLTKSNERSALCLTCHDK